MAKITFKIPPFIEWTHDENKDTMFINAFINFVLFIIFDVLFYFGLKAFGHNLPHPFKHIVFGGTVIIETTLLLLTIREGILSYRRKKEQEKEREVQDKTIVSIMHTHKDMQDVKKLYNYYFPPEGGNPSFSEINTWIKETDSLKGKYREGNVLDFMLLAKINSVVCGFLIVTFYYKSNSFAFISYLMVDWKTKNKEIRCKLSTVSDDIADYLRDNLLANQLKGCTGFVAETNKNIDKSSKIIKKPEVYIEDFKEIIRRCINTEMWENETFPYLQPHAPKQKPLKIGGEKEMFLLYARRKILNRFTAVMPDNCTEPNIDELKLILDFTYKKIYWDSCQYNRKLEIKYREYLTELYDKVWSAYLGQQSKDLTPKDA
jgi:hypothetical protein